MKANTRVYRLADAGNPPEQAFVNLSGQTFNTIHANDYSYFEEINAIIQEEPVDNVDPELLGLLAAIGIEKGKPFAPDARMKALAMRRRARLCSPPGIPRPTSLRTVTGRPASLAAAMNFRLTECGCWMPAPCFSITPPGLLPPWRRKW
jgi:hypothetical protein